MALHVMHKEHIAYASSGRKCCHWTFKNQPH